MGPFKSAVEEIFRQAGVPIAGNEALAKQAEGILSDCMAMLSPGGLTQSRIDHFNKQKATLVQDLIGMRERGEVEMEVA